MYEVVAEFLTECPANCTLATEDIEGEDILRAIQIRRNIFD